MKTVVISNSPKKGAAEGDVCSTACCIPVEIKDGGKKK